MFALDFWQQGRWEVSFIFLHFLVNHTECRISLCVLHNLGLLLLEVLNFRVSLYGRGTISRFDYNSDWKFCLINGLCYWGMFSLYKSRYSLDTGNFLFYFIFLNCSIFLETKHWARVCLWMLLTCHCYCLIFWILGFHFGLRLKLEFL